jgi:hypothetical protein
LSVVQVDVERRCVAQNCETHLRIR